MAVSSLIDYARWVSKREPDRLCHVSPPPERHYEAKKRRDGVYARAHRIREARLLRLSRQAVAARIGTFGEPRQDFDAIANSDELCNLRAIPDMP